MVPKPVWGLLIFRKSRIPNFTMRFVTKSLVILKYEIGFFMPLKLSIFSPENYTLSPTWYGLAQLCFGGIWKHIRNNTWRASLTMSLSPWHTFHSDFSNISIFIWFNTTSWLVQCLLIGVRFRPPDEQCT